MVNAINSNQYDEISDDEFSDDEFSGDEVSSDEISASQNAVITKGLQKES